MISGEAGEAIMQRVLAHRLDALVDGDEITCSLIAAVYADALRKGQTPREVLDALWQSMPSCDDWRSRLRKQIEGALDAVEAAA